MRQEINLFLPEFRPQRVLLGLDHLVIIWAAVLLIMASVIASDFIGYRAGLSELQQQRQRSESITQKLTQLQQRSPKSQQLALQKNLDQLSQQITEKEQIIAIFTSTRLGNRQGFSGFLLGLSEQHVEGVAVDQFSITDGGRYAAISGVAEKAEAVPYYLQQLQQHTEFSATEFGPLSIKKHKTQPAIVTFRLLEEGEYDG